MVGQFLGTKRGFGLFFWNKERGWEILGITVTGWVILGNKVRGAVIFGLINFPKLIPHLIKMLDHVIVF